MATMISQFSCFSAINPSLRLQQRLSFPIQSPSLRLPKKLSIVVSLERNHLDTSDSQAKSNLSYGADASKSQVEETTKSYPAVEEPEDGNFGTGEPVQEHEVAVPKRAAKIHDFCFGIPFGGLILSGGLIGLIFSRNPATLSSLIFGGALLALSTLSLNIWRQGKSSLPFILGQTVLTAAVFWKNFKSYSLTKKVFPTGFYVAISAAMLCFYSYVMISGGNPPPKKSKLSQSVS